jgi:hypothetical protein
MLSDTEAELEKEIKATYFQPAPRWVISQDDIEFEVYDAQMLKLVNSFLSQYLLGEVIEEWTACGKTYRYTNSKSLWERGFGDET